MAKFIDLSVFRSKERGETETKMITLNPDCITRFFNADEADEKYWGYRHTILNYSNCNELVEIRVLETPFEIKKLVNSL